MDTYSGSAETELLSKLTKHIPSVGSQSASPDDDGGTPVEGLGASHDATGGGNTDSDARKNIGEENDGSHSTALDAAKALIDAFDEHVDVARLLRDIREHAIAGAHRGTTASTDPSGLPPLPPTEVGAPSPRPTAGDNGPASKATPAIEDAAGIVEQPQGVGGGQEGRGGAEDAKDSSLVGITATKATTRAARKSREEVEAEAAKEGASGG